MRTNIPAFRLPAAVSTKSAIGMGWICNCRAREHEGAARGEIDAIFVSGMKNRTLNNRPL
jgi:hypothetical protein